MMDNVNQYLKSQNCPFCGRDRVFVGVHDDEGNYHGRVGCAYENDPWSGLSYALHHEGWGECIMCTGGAYGVMGGVLFDTPGEAIDAWNRRSEEAWAGECIDRQAAIDLFYPVDPENDGSDGCTIVYKPGKYSSDEIEAMLSDLPAADVALVRRGRWIELEECANEGVYCSVCRKKVYKANYKRNNNLVKMKSPYCPNCGAKMDLEECNV